MVRWATLFLATCGIEEVGGWVATMASVVYHFNQHSDKSRVADDTNQVQAQVASVRQRKMNGTKQAYTTSAELQVNMKGMILSAIIVATLALPHYMLSEVVMSCFTVCSLIGRPW